ncbi:MAG: hypothetical protein AAB925_02450 [Patescibacteria group bacterium]
MSKKIIFWVLLIVAIAGVVAFWFYREGVFSKEILRLEILGPDTANVGDEIEYTVKYKNNGNFVLEQPKLIFELPENSLIEDGKIMITQDLKDIYPGDEEFVKFKARLLGKEKDLKVAKASLSYIPKNITARYESDTTFTTKIDSVSVTLDFDLPSKAEKGKEMKYSVNYFSNIDYPMENLSIKIDPVNGFNFESSDPSSLDNSEWKLKTLNKAQGGRINITGKITADPGSHLNFSAKLGMRIAGSFIEIKETKTDVEVIEPLLFISQQINGSANYVASPGELLHYEIFFRNIGSTAFDNLFMVVNLNGPAFDTSTIQAEDGQAQPNNNLIVWDWKQVQGLKHLDVQQEESVKFNVKLKDSWPLSDSEKNNIVVKNSVNISQITQDFDTKVNSNLGISQKGYYQNSVISNSGPIPPIAGKATTYTITWTINNYFNDLKNVKVKANLAQNVALTGLISPESEFSNFSFDNSSREIVWSAGDVAASAGNSKSISFQISLTPANNQKNFIVDIISGAVISGEDQATGTTITAKSSAINTSMPDDPTISGRGMVQ